MMDLKQKHMLKADIGTLHFETKEWISETYFYEEELHFLKQLIQNRIGVNTTEGRDHKEIYQHIETMLTQLSDEFHILLADHKKLLFTAMDKEDSKEKAYIISEHKDLTLKMTALKTGVVQLKKSIFGYIKKNPFGFVTSSLSEDQEA